MKRFLLVFVVLAIALLAQPNPDVVYRTYKATIASCGNLSAAVDLRGCAVLRLEMPASWTTANLTFQISSDASTYRDMYDAYGTEYTVMAAASRAIIMSAGDFFGVRYFKIRSGTSGTPVTQTAARSIGVVCVQ